MVVRIFKKDFEKSKRIEARDQTYDVGIHAEHIAECNLAAPEALEIASGLSYIVVVS